MSLLYRFKYARGLSPAAAASKALRLARRTIAGTWGQALRNRRCTYGTVASGGAPFPYGYAPETPSALLGPSSPAIADFSEHALAHRFNLLGSGWIRVEHAMSCAGFEGYQYPPSAISGDAESLISALSPGNRAQARRIRDLIGPGYRPIDWQIDFKSGYRWSESQWSPAVKFGHAPGVDIKVPWELARLQHLPHLAWAYVLASSGADGWRTPQEYRDEFRNQVLDFLAANPPQFGVNWACAMDVAIRAANLLMAMDLFRRHGAEFDGPFLDVFTAGVHDHGRFLAANLEWSGQFRGNHYLADIAGLLFCAAYLQRTPETDCWLAFAVRQLISEVERQFTPDGANFEASTGYHRLSAEIVAYGTALVLALDGDKRQALEAYDNSHWRAYPPLPQAPLEMHPIPGDGERTSPFPAWYFQRLERMAEFIGHAGKPNHKVAQIGDMDSGRFFKLCPIVGKSGEESHLDQRATIAAINGLFSRGDLASFAGARTELETALTAGLSGWRRVASHLKADEAPAANGVTVSSQAAHGAAALKREIIIAPPDPACLEGLETAAYPDFGLYIWRSPRFFLSVRCGPVGQQGNGGHAHNDQLAIELNIDGKDWLADPGSYVYTAAPALRDAYRSVRAHSGPSDGEREPARLDHGMFRLQDSANATCLRFDKAGFHGVHSGFGVPVHRVVLIEKDRIVIGDSAAGQNAPAERHVVSDAPSLKALLPCSVPFSQGYGVKVEEA